jgi:hypothetical protein
MDSGGGKISVRDQKVRTDIYNSQHGFGTEQLQNSVAGITFLDQLKDFVTLTQSSPVQPSSMAHCASHQVITSSCLCASR